MEELDPTRDKKGQGLIRMYSVERLDGKPIAEGVFLEFNDKNSWGALRVWADVMAGEGYTKLAVEVREKINQAIEMKEVEKLKKKIDNG